MAITITVTADDNHTISTSKKILSRQGELGEVITFSVPAAFAATYGLAWIMVQQPDGQLYYIDNGSGTGFDHASTNSFTYTIGDRDTMLSTGGALGLQVVLRDAVPPAQTVEWRSRILNLTIEDSILSNVDSGGSLIDSLSSGTLNRLADIQYDSLADGDLLYRDTATGKWRNVTLVEGLHITATLNKTSGTLTLSATGDISPNAEDVLLADVAGNFVATEVEGALAELFDETVKNTGNETIDGIKTFSSSPIVPTPTTDYQAGTKKYADDLFGSVEYPCKAWVNFNGTGTVAIRASYNVSSITDNGTGDYTINFATALADADYAWAQGIRSSENLGGTSTVSALSYADAVQTASALRVQTRHVNPATGALADQPLVSIVVFR